VAVSSIRLTWGLGPRYLALERNGKAESLAASADLSIVQPLTDQELIDAIQELNRSTDAINKQTETLRQQQNAVSRLITASSKSGDARSSIEAKRLYQWESSRKALHTSVRSLRFDQTAILAADLRL
jgi:seryl-tRNA synthetase